MIVAKAGLGQEMPFSQAEADKALQDAMNAGPVAPGSVQNLGPYQDPMKSGSGSSGGGLLDSLKGLTSGSGGSGSGGTGSLISSGLDAVKSGIKAVTGKTGSSSAAGVKASSPGMMYVCTSLYNACKAFISDSSNQAKFKDLSTKDMASAARQTMNSEMLACSNKFKSGGFGSFKKGDAKGNAAAYKLYQACTAAASKKYVATVGKTNTDLQWMSTFREAQHYVKNADLMRANGAQMISSGCTSAAEKNLLARLNAAALPSLTMMVIGGLIIVGSGLLAWKLL